MTSHKCNQCGKDLSREYIRCPACGELGTVEKVEKPEQSAGLRTTGAVKPTKRASTIKDLKNRPIKRTKTNIGELDRVLGGGFVDSEVILFSGKAGSGKALSDDTMIPLSKGGMCRLSEVSVGDEILDMYGNPTVILEIHKPEVKKTYEVKFNDGSRVRACEDHLWSLFPMESSYRHENIKVMKTKELAESTERYKLPIPVIKTYKNRLREEPFEEAVERFLRDDEIPKEEIYSSVKRRSKIVSKFFEELGEEREDGAIIFEFPTERLAEDFRQILITLGYFTKLREKNVEVHKAERVITSVDPTMREGEYSCLMVDSETKTFLATENFIPTHNSTLSLSIADSLAEQEMKVLYSSGEESEQQIGLRANRMEIDNDNIRIVNETNLEKLLGHIEEEDPDLVIVDSLQTIASSSIDGGVGSVQQSREAAHTLTRLAKQQSIKMILVSQMIKSGETAGSTQINHVVDCILSLESDSESPLKFLRSEKNRFGATDEVGVFQHTDKGLEEVVDPSSIFLDTDESYQTGSAKTFISEGIRQIPVEIQALATSSNLPHPRKQFNGINYNRGQIVCAILDKFNRAKLYENDVFVSTISGIRISDPQADLAVAVAIYTSLKGLETPADIAFIGELGLTGKVRGNFLVNAKVKEAARLGFKEIIVPSNSKQHIYEDHRGIKVRYISKIQEMSKFL